MVKKSLYLTKNHFLTNSRFLNQTMQGLSTSVILKKGAITMLSQPLINTLSKFMNNCSVQKEAYLVFNDWVKKESIRFDNIQDIEWCLMFITDVYKIKQHNVLKNELFPM